MLVLYYTVWVSIYFNKYIVLCCKKIIILPRQFYSINRADIEKGPFSSEGLSNCFSLYIILCIMYIRGLIIQSLYLLRISYTWLMHNIHATIWCYCLVMRYIIIIIVQNFFTFKALTGDFQWISDIYNNKKSV